MTALAFLGVAVGIINTIILAVIIFIIKQPDPQQGRQQADVKEIQEKLTDLAKHLLSFEKKLEGLINESKNENLAKLERVKTDVSHQLKSIHDNL